MKKLLSLVTVLLMLFTVSAMADSDSYVSGSINQGSSAIVQPSFSHPDMFGNAAASGSQNGGGSFFAHPASPSGEEASGSVTSNGSVTVQADVIHNGNQSIISTASGIAGNAGEVHIL
jgi:hypothetical protein